MFPISSRVIIIILFTLKKYNYVLLHEKLPKKPLE